MNRWTGILVLLSLGMMAANIQAAPPDQDNTLLDRATKIWAYPPEELWTDRPYSWLSEDEILTFKRTGTDRLQTYTPIQRNLKTGKESRPRAAELLETSEAFTAGSPPTLSPDTTRILYRGPTEKYCLVALNGSQTQTWQGTLNQSGTSSNKLTFLNDRKCLVLEDIEVERLYCGTDLIGRIPPPQPRAKVSGKIYERGEDNPVHRFHLEVPLADNPGRIEVEPVKDRIVIVTHLVPGIEPNAGNRQRGSGALEIAEYALEDKPRLLRKNRFSLPRGMVANPVVFAPSGDKIAVLAGGPLRDAEGRIITEMDPMTGLRSARWVQGIWIGDLRKGSFRELGRLTWWTDAGYASQAHLESTPYQGGTYRDSIYNVGFTHDETRVSFYQNHVLYTLPAAR